MKMTLRFTWILIIISCIVSGCAGTRPATLGISSGKLAPCPGTPNCVSSQIPDAKHYVEPLRFSTSASEAAAALTRIIAGMKRTRVVEARASYIQVEFTSALFRFVDDVEFYFDDDSRSVHIRSASRLGRYDFGVNRRRVDAIRAQWNALLGDNQ